MSRNNENRYTLRQYLRTGLFFSLYGVVKYWPAPLGDIARACILKCFARSVRSLRIKDGATFWFPEGISIGRQVSINEWVFIDGFGGVTIGDNVRIAHRASIVSENHGIDQRDKPIYMQKKIKGAITIGDDVWIGMDAKILMGVTIGHGAVIGAGAVITRDVPPYGIMVGNPGRLLRYRGELEQEPCRNENIAS